jgi:bifunctional non-homologous end joining protein LigD
VSAHITAGRHTVEISHPDKQLIPPDVTKLDLARYYEQVSDQMLPLVRDRPLNLERYPDGIDGAKVFQQHAGKHFPSWIRRVEVPKKGGTVEHVLAGDAATLVYLANQGCVTLHSWLSRADRLDRPDRLIFDLDPSVEDQRQMLRATKLIIALLRELALEPLVMSSGSRGYHVVVPLQRRAGYDVVRQFAHDVAALGADREPELFTIEQRKAKRGGRILIDYMRNGYGHTSVAPYAVRARPRAPVATPLHERELDDPATAPQRYTLRTIPQRLASDGDPWSGIAADAQTLTAARRRLEQLRAER